MIQRLYLEFKGSSNASCLSSILIVFEQSFIVYAFISRGIILQVLCQNLIGSTVVIKHLLKQAKQFRLLVQKQINLINALTRKKSEQKIELKACSPPGLPMRFFTIYTLRRFFAFAIESMCKMSEFVEVTATTSDNATIPICSDFLKL